MRAFRLLLLVFLAAALPGPGLLASRPRGEESLPAAPLGPIVEAPDGVSEMELVRFEARVAAALSALAPEETIRVEDWPVAPGRRAVVVLRRFDVYAPDARIVVIDGGREVEVPRSPTIFFMGVRTDAPGRLLVAFDPEKGSIRASQEEDGTRFELRTADDGSGLHRLAAKAAFRAAQAPPLAWSCGQEETSLEEGGASPEPATDGGEPGRGVQALAPATRVAVIAVDTDNEFLDLKFANNAADATTYIANLFAEMNVIYERDVNLRLLQGYTILRPSTTADPYLQSGTGNADSAKLGEFRDYWRDQYPSVNRALGMMLSGKQGSDFNASGIAVLDCLCDYSFGYSFSQVFKFAEQTASEDVGVIAHEIGHNLASPHTHCYANPKPDTCFALEACYSGPTACPATTTYNGVSARGTLMSYCHMLSGCSKADVFHPDSLTRYVNGAIAAAGSCVFAIGNAAPTITSLSVTSGPLAGGTSTVITGTNFVNGATVAFVELPSNNVFGTPSSKLASTVSFNGPTQLTVTTPSATNAGAVDVVVMNPDFQTATRPGGFTYGAGPAPFALTSLSPITGPATGGTAIVLTGSGFLAGATVTLRGAAATSVSVPNSTTITAVTPARTVGPADVVVTNPGGATATIPGGFVYTATGAATRLNTFTPCRLVDTRNAVGPFGGPALAAGAVRSFTVSSGSCGIPADAAGVSLNVTVADATALGTLTFFPGSGTVPGTNTLSFVPGKNRANNVAIGVVGGVLSVRNYQVSGSVNLIVDVNGYYR